MRVNERMNELDENNVRRSRGGILVVPLVHFSMCPFCVVIDIICTGLNKKQNSFYIQQIFIIERLYLNENVELAMKQYRHRFILEKRICQ